LKGHCNTLCLGSRWSWSCYLSEKVVGDREMAGWNSNKMAEP
jgi:hypothetical protein